MTQEQLVARLRELRTTAGLSQRELAARLGLTQGWVNKVETGLRGIDLDVVSRWAVACGTHAELVIGQDMSDVGPILASLDAGRRRLALNALRALSSLPLTELDLEADMLERRAAQLRARSATA